MYNFEKTIGFQENQIEELQNVIKKKDDIIQMNTEVKKVLETQIDELRLELEKSKNDQQLKELKEMIIDLKNNNAAKTEKNM